MPAKTLALSRQVDQTEKIVSSRVPLEALQMLTQSVSKCNQDYIQPLPLKEDEQKKSPLVLLAATCSSIGKAEPTKTAERDSSSISSKISSDESRSSFKPYKQSPEKEEEMTEKSGFRSPAKENMSRLSPTEPKEERNKTTSIHHPDLQGHYGFVHQQPNRVCGSLSESGQSQHPPIHKEYEGTCHPTTLLPIKGSLPYHALPSPEQTALKTHGIPTSNVSSIYPQCACVYCAPHGENAQLSRQFHMPATPYMDYLQRTICREPNCTHCRSHASPYGVPSQQYGHHCVQCDITKPTEPTPHAAPYYYPHGLTMFKNTHEEGHPFVCNWVSGGKHCGKSFTTSEELFQHLRTHTQLGNNSSSSPPIPSPSGPCNIPGCPCKQGPVQSSYHASRYRPYYLKPSLIPNTPTVPISCYSPSPYASLHGLPYDPHRLFK